MRVTQSLLKIAQEAKEASKKLRLKTTEQKNKTLLLIAEQLEVHKEEILRANECDLKAASHLPEVMLDRLSLAGGRLSGVIADVVKVVSLPDPVGEILSSTVLENGLHLTKKRVPIGVIGVIYEARPNVTVDIASLCLKTSNCAILRGGKETLNTNKALIRAIQTALEKGDFPKKSLQLITSTSRSQVKQLVKLDAYIDMIIPRGGAQLHRFCIEESTIPVITGGIGICHLFVDASADLDKSVEVVFNAKTQRPSVCNALDTLLVHKRVAETFLPKLIRRLESKEVSYRLDDPAWKILKPEDQELFYQKASEQDWQTEWLRLILGIKIVDSLEEAIEHIQRYSTQHSDGILTNSEENALEFIKAVDSGAVYVNASTRFTDGGQFGLGAEVAVSTQKLHARGPMGLNELTTYKWIVHGNYHTRQ